MAKDSRRNRRSQTGLEAPEGFVPQEIVAAELARQAEVAEVPSPPDNADDRVSNIPPNAAGIHSGPEVGKGQAERKEPKDFFRDVLISVIERESTLLQRGLAMIREINSGQKRWKAVEGSDTRELKLGLLKKISSINLDDENLQREVERLSNIQGYNIDELKTKINSNSEIVAARGSSQSNEEGRREFGKLLRRLIRNEVRDIFRNNKIANASEVLKIALHIENVMHKGMVNIVDAPPRRIVQEKKKAEPEKIVEIESESDKRKKKLVRENTEENFADVLNNHFENILQRWQGGKGLGEGDIQTIKREFEQDKAGINDDIINRVFQELTEKMKPFERDLIDTQVFLRMREEVIKRAEEYIRKKEIDLLREQRAELVHLITEAVKFKNQFDESQMEQVVKMVFEEDPVLERLFSGDQLPQAISHVLNQVNKFRDKK